MYSYFPVYIFFLALPACIWASIGSIGTRRYILSRDCSTMPPSIVGLEELHTRTLRIDDLEDGAVIYSHDFESHSPTNATSALLESNYYAQYPLDFACEVVVHAPIENGRIMLFIESFAIPTGDQVCNDFLYVFDSNTARSKAMPEAGGEQGLCLSRYQRVSVFSSKSYICIAFHSANSRLPSLPSSSSSSSTVASTALQPGFKIVVTPFLETQTASCPDNRFYCGSVTNTVAASPSGMPTSGIDFPAPRPPIRLPAMGICVSEAVRCDGVLNCPAGNDESPTLCTHYQDASSRDSENAFFGLFVSLGLTTSVSVLVASSVFVVFCLTCIACLCCRRRYRSRNHPANRFGFNRSACSNGQGAGALLNSRPRSGGDVAPVFGGLHTSSDGHSGLLKSPEVFQHQMLQQQQMVLPPAKSMGDLFQHQQVPQNSPMLRHFQSPPPPPQSWNLQPICCPQPPPPTNQQWYPQASQQLPVPTQNRISDMSMPQQQPMSPTTRYPYQTPPPDTSQLVADGGIVYLGEVSSPVVAGGSGSGGSRLPGGPRRPHRHSGRAAVDTQSSSSFGGPTTRGAQSAEGAPRTASNSSHSIGPSYSSSRGATANNVSSNGSVHHHGHHRHRRRRHGGGGSSGKQSTRNASSSERIAFPVEL